MHRLKLPAGISVCIFLWRFLIFRQYSQNVLFQFRNMANYKSPQEFCLYAVIPVYDSVACVYNVSCVWNLKSRVLFSNAIDSFSHYFCFPFNSAYPQSVFFKQVKAFRETFKKSLQLLYCIQHILQIFENININHKSSVLCC